MCRSCAWISFQCSSSGSRDAIRIGPKGASGASVFGPIVMLPGVRVVVCLLAFMFSVFLVWYFWRQCYPGVLWVVFGDDPIPLRVAIFRFLYLRFVSLFCVSCLCAQVLAGWLFPFCEGCLSGWGCFPVLTAVCACC